MNPTPMRNVLAIACLSGVACFAQAAPTFVGTDPTWQVFDAQGQAAGSAQLVCSGILSGCPWSVDLSPLPGAGWIWAPGLSASTDNVSDTAFIFVKSFDLAPGAWSASLALAADDMAEVSLNGQSVGAIGSVTDIALASDAQSHLHSFDVTRWLTPGSNVLRITVHNGPASFAGLPDPTFADNPAGVVAGLTVSAVPEPATLQALLLGLVLLTYRRISRRG